MTTPDESSRNGGSRPGTDPTALTTDALQREISQLRELLETKIAVLDTKITGHFIVDQTRFAGMDTQLAVTERLRIEQKRDTQEALAAALTSAKEAVAAQDQANQKAITKSELTTADTLNKLEQLITVKTDALGDKIASVKETANGTVQQRVGGTESRTAMFAVIGMIVTVGLAVLTVVGFVLANAP